MHKRATGNKGEDIACTFLKKKGFAIVGRNYSRKWGELDIIGEKDKIIHFFEVKSVTADFSAGKNAHRPEDNVHGLKRNHIRRIIETYLDDKGMGLDAVFQFHVVTVFMNQKTRLARVKLIENVIL